MSTPLLWLIAGSILCLMEFIFPTAFVAFMMGIGALLVAALGFFVPHLSLQVALWMVFSTSLVILSRRFFTPNPRRAHIRDYKEGETLTAIAPGKTGRVLYEGNSWRAQCDLEYEGIAPHEKVYVLREEGTTLIVFPAKILESSNY